MFIKLGVLPELLGKWYSREPVASISSTGNEQVEECAHGELCCYCRKEEYGELMIYCDNNDCCIQWFHTTCLQITTIPKVKWYCPDCQRKPIKVL